MAKPEIETDYNGTASFFFRGDASDKVGTLFTEWLEKICAEHDLQITSCSCQFYYNYKGPAPGSKKPGHPNEGGKDSFSTKVGA